MVVAKYTYAENGLPSEKVLADGTKITYRHDPLGRITGMRVISAKGKELTDLKYSWDTAGQLASRTWSGIEQKYSYDLAGQLIGVHSSSVDRQASSALRLPSERYAYDLAGNMIEKTIGDSQTRMLYDEANRLLKAVTEKGNISKETVYAYDSAGRLASEKEGDSVKNYEYGLFEKVNAIAKADGSRTGFDYWPDGQLAAKGQVPPLAAVEKAV